MPKHSKRKQKPRQDAKPGGGADRTHDALKKAADALFEAAQIRAVRLASLVEKLEARHATVESPVSSDFYVPTEHGTEGSTLHSGWEDHAPALERPLRRKTVDATLALREAIDCAMDAVSRVANCMDGAGQSVEQRWSVRTIGHLRKLRGAILRGHGCDAFPSALPMIRAGVPDALREHARHVLDRMEEVKSAILVSPELMAHDPSAGSGRPAAPRRKGGRPADTDPKRDARIDAAWQTGHHRTYAECADVLARAWGTPLTKRQVELAIQRHRKRRKN